jgi:hypothetical protein
MNSNPNDDEFMTLSQAQENIATKFTIVALNLLLFALKYFSENINDIHANKPEIISNLKIHIESFLSSRCFTHPYLYNHLIQYCENMCVSSNKLHREFAIILINNVKEYQNQIEQNIEARRLELGYESQRVKRKKIEPESTSVSASEFTNPLAMLAHLACEKINEGKYESVTEFITKIFPNATKEKMHCITRLFFNSSVLNNFTELISIDTVKLLINLHMSFSKCMKQNKTDAYIFNYIYLVITKMHKNKIQFEIFIDAHRQHYQTLNDESYILIKYFINFLNTCMKILEHHISRFSVGKLDYNVIARNAVFRDDISILLNKFINVYQPRIPKLIPIGNGKENSTEIQSLNNSIKDVVVISDTEDEVVCVSNDNSKIVHSEIINVPEKLGKCTMRIKHDKIQHPCQINI